MTAAAYDAAPELDLASWEDVAEVSVHAQTDNMTVLGLMFGPPEEIPNLASAGPGDYRIRVHANGRDTGAALDVAEVPVEDYLIAVWPSTPAPHAVLKMTSNYGRNKQQDARRRSK